LNGAEVSLRGFDFFFTTIAPPDLPESFFFLAKVLDL
jgi:hypothetical protein